MSNSNVKCKKCRIVLFSTDEYPVLNAHGKAFGNSEGSLEDSSCSSLSNLSSLYLLENPVPEFLKDSLDKGGWVKGKIHCPKCQSRIGSFNFVTGSHCSCGNFESPPLHLLTSKVDYIKPNEKVNFPVSFRFQSASQAISLPRHENNHHPSVPFDDILSVGMEDICKVSTSPTIANSNNSPDVNMSLEAVSPNTNTFQDSNEVIINSFPNQLSHTTHPVNNIRQRRKKRRATSGDDSLDSLRDDLLTNPHPSDEVLTLSSRFHVLGCDDINEMEELSDSSSSSEDSIPSDMTCPVCLDLLYSPMTTKPCGHIFCEPCLRRLGKPTPHHTFCPLCRKLIGICQSCPDISKKTKEKYPDRYENRWKFEKNNSTRDFPLPYTPHYRFLGLQGRMRLQYGLNWHGWKTVMWILSLDFLALVLVLIIRYFFWMANPDGTVGKKDSVTQKQSPGIPTNVPLQLQSSQLDINGQDLQVEEMVL